MGDLDPAKLLYVRMLTLGRRSIRDIEEKIDCLSDAMNSCGEAKAANDVRQACVTAKVCAGLVKGLTILSTYCRSVGPVV